MKREMPKATSMLRQAGLSLVELMIAIALGITLTAGVIQVFFSSTQTFSLGDDLGQIQQNGRMALDLMTRNIRMAGYRHPDNGNLPDYFFRGTCGAWANCTTNNNGSGVNSDRIAIWMDPPPDDGSEIGCTGQALGATEEVANVFYIDTVDDVSSLYCRSWSVTNNAWVNAAAGQPLVDGIESMHILYGVGDGDGVTQYVSADRVTDWSAVRSLRVSLLVNNGTATGRADNMTRNFVVLDSTRVSFTDRFLRHIYTTTIQITNSAMENTI